MKSRAQLEEIAQRLVDHIGALDLSCNNFPDCDVISAILADALEAVQSDTAASLIKQIRDDKLKVIVRISEDDLENEAAYFHLDNPKMSVSQMFFEGARWVQNKLLGEAK